MDSLFSMVNAHIFQLRQHADTIPEVVKQINKRITTTLKQFKKNPNVFKHLSNSLRFLEHHIGPITTQ